MPRFWGVYAYRGEFCLDTGVTDERFQPPARWEVISKPLEAGFSCRLDSAAGAAGFRWGPADRRGLAGYHFFGVPAWLVVLATATPPAYRAWCWRSARRGR